MYVNINKIKLKYMIELITTSIKKEDTADELKEIFKD